MQLYCKTQSAFRPVAFGISAVAAGTTVTVLIHATDWEMPWKIYILVGIILWILYSFLAYRILGPVNRFLIKVFGVDQLKKRQKLIALEIVRALYDRKPELDLPVQDEDLVTREAALSFSHFFAQD